MASNKQNLVGLTDALGGSASGLISMWHLSGMTSMVRLSQEWHARGLDPMLLPALPSSEVAVRRACNEQDKPGYPVRPLKKTKGGAATSAYLLTREVRTEASADYDHSDDLVVRLLADETLEFDSSYDKRIAVIEADFQRFQCELVAQDVSHWLCARLIPNVRGLSMRDCGGVYFVPAEYRGTWEAMIEAVECSGAHLFFTNPAMPADRAVKYLLHCLEQDSDAIVSKVEEKMAGGECGPLALRNQQDVLEGVRTRLTYWEGILGKSLINFGEKLERTKANLAAAVLAAEADAE